MTQDNTPTPRPKMTDSEIRQCIQNLSDAMVILVNDMKIGMNRTMMLEQRIKRMEQRLEMTSKKGSDQK